MQPSRERTEDWDWLDRCYVEAVEMLKDKWSPVNNHGCVKEWSHPWECRSTGRPRSANTQFCEDDDIGTQGREHRRCSVQLPSLVRVQEMGHNVTAVQDCKITFGLICTVQDVLRDRGCH